MRKLLLPTVVLALAPALFADGPEFDVASIKPFVPPAGGMVFIGPTRGGPGTDDPTHITIDAAQLKGIVVRAFDVKNYQVSGPDTLDTSQFQFAVVVPVGATKEQVNVMWQNLLVTRFGMKYHIEKKEFNVDELIVGPKGHKLKENTDAPSADRQGPPLPPGPPKFDKDGKMNLTGPGMVMFMSSGPSGVTAKAAGRAQPMSALANMLSNQVGHPVIDKTNLTGKYDFDVEFFPTNLRGGPLAPPPGAGGNPTAGAAPELGLDLGTAVQQQLGLRLVGGKDKLDVIVVDKIEKTPTEN